jgi:AbrB family looped-hinge helix DNA binding protein
METVFTVVSAKGQIVIPAALRDELGIEAGTRLAIQRQEITWYCSPSPKNSLAAWSVVARERLAWLRHASADTG